MSGRSKVFATIGGRVARKGLRRKRYVPIAPMSVASVPRTMSNTPKGEKKKFVKKTTYCKSGDRFGEDEGEQHEYFGYAKLHGAERYCVECYGQGKIQSGNHSRSCQINKRFFQNTPRFFLLMGIADTIESMVSYKNRKRNRKANITMIKNAKNA
mgnify:CR=1 FL=1